MEIDKLAITDTQKADTIGLNELIEAELNSIKLDWKSSRKTCGCANKLDSVSRKLNCPRCGKIFCEICVEDGEYLPLSTSGKLIFICKECLHKK